MNQSKKTVIIIGGGLGGLATAAYLAKQSYQVTILEKNRTIGGRAGFYQEQGYSFDTGPSWYWMPEIFEKFFADFGKHPSDYYSLQQIDPAYRVFFDKDTSLDIPSNPTEVVSLVESLEPGSGKKLQKILTQGADFLKLAIDDFLYKDYPSIFSLLNWKVASNVLATGGLLPYEYLIKSNFKDPRVRALLSWHTLFLGASPKNLPALYSFMLNVDYVHKTWYPLGGMSKVIDGVRQLLEELGVTIETESEVSSIDVVNGKATGVHVANGKYFTADIIVSNADYFHTEHTLLGGEWRSMTQSWWKKRTYSPATMLYYLGIGTKLKKSLHHNYYFNVPAWEKQFAMLFTEKRWPDEVPSYYFHATSKTDPHMAPPGKESVYVLVPIASGVEDTEEQRATLFDRIIPHLEALTETPIRNHLEVVHMMGPRDHENQFNAHLGNNFGLAQTLFQTGPFRPYNKSRKVNNLFYVGHYTHPGIGLPMVLISGKVTASCVEREYES